MSAADKFSEMLEMFRRNLAEGRLAHAFVVQGSPSGEAKIFVESALQLLFCEGLTKPCGECRECHKVTDRNHPDIAWLEPQKKSRTFDVEEQIRPMLRDFAQTSYQGGWKAVVIFEADRLNDSHSNAILKALEEPGQRRLWFLLTAHPDQLLTTIHSRCQRIVLSQAQAEFSGTWVAPLREWLLRGPAPAGIPALADAAYLKALVDVQSKEIERRVKDEVGDDDVDDDVFNARVKSQTIKVRAEMLQYILLWRRDVLACACGADAGVLNFADDAATLMEQAKDLGVAGALASIRRVEEINRRFDRNMPELQVFEAALLAG